MSDVLQEECICCGKKLIHKNEIKEAGSGVMCKICYEKDAIEADMQLGSFNRVGSEYDE